MYLDRAEVCFCILYGSFFIGVEGLLNNNDSVFSLGTLGVDIYDLLFKPPVSFGLKMIKEEPCFSRVYSGHL